MDDATTERIAREFHEGYERLAPEHGWKSQTPVAWDHLPLNNKLLMLAVVRELPWIKEQALKLDAAEKEIERLENIIINANRERARDSEYDALRLVLD